MPCTTIAEALIDGCIFINLCSALLTNDFKEISMAEHKYMNIPPQHTINALMVTPLYACLPA